MSQKKVGTFDVLKVMCDRNMDVRLSTLDNVTQLLRTKHGTKITIGFSGDVMEIARGKFVGGMLIADAEQFRAIQRELESQKA